MCNQILVFISTLNRLSLTMHSWNLITEMRNLYRINDSCHNCYINRMKKTLFSKFDWHVVEKVLLIVCERTENTYSTIVLFHQLNLCSIFLWFFFKWRNICHSSIEHWLRYLMLPFQIFTPLYNDKINYLKHFLG